MPPIEDDTETLDRPLLSSLRRPPEAPKKNPFFPARNTGVAPRPPFSRYTPLRAQSRRIGSTTGQTRRDRFARRRGARTRRENPRNASARAFTQPNRGGGLRLRNKEPPRKTKPRYRQSKEGTIDHAPTNHDSASGQGRMIPPVRRGADSPTRILSVAEKLAVAENPAIQSA